MMRWGCSDVPWGRGWQHYERAVIQSCLAHRVAVLCLRRGKLHLQGGCTHLWEGGVPSPMLPQAAPRPQPDSDVVPDLPLQRQVPGGGAGWDLSTCQQQARGPLAACATRVRPAASQSESESEDWGWRDPFWHRWQREASLVQTWSGVHLSCCLQWRGEQSHRSPGSQPPGPR